MAAPGASCGAMDPVVVVFGLLVGVLVGLTGIGGGSLMTPLLILVLGVQPVVAIGTDVAYGAITKTVGGWRHLRLGTVDRRLSTWLAFGSVPGAGGRVAGGAVSAIAGRCVQRRVLVCIAVALLVVALAVLARALFMPQAAGPRAPRRRSGWTPPRGRRTDRRGGRPRARFHVARQRRARWTGADHVLPPHSPASGGDRRLSRCDPAVGGRGLHTSSRATSTSS